MPRCTTRRPNVPAEPDHRADSAIERSRHVALWLTGIGAALAIALSLSDRFIPAYDRLTRKLGVEDNAYVGGDASVSLHVVGWGLFTVAICLLAAHLRTMPLYALGAFGFGVVIETLQSTSSTTRGFAARDLMANLAGCIVGLVVAVAVRMWLVARTRKEPSHRG